MLFRQGLATVRRPALYTMSSLLKDARTRAKKAVFFCGVVHPTGHPDASILIFMKLLMYCAKRAPLLQKTQSTRGGAVTVVWHTLCKLCMSLPPQQCGPDYRFLGKSVMRTDGWLVLLLMKAGGVETNPGPTNTPKQVWICARKQISIRCNRIEHWLHIRYAGIRIAQYAYTWTGHQHTES